MRRLALALLLVLGMLLLAAAEPRRLPLPAGVRLAPGQAAVALDEQLDSLIADNNRPTFAFRYPDVYGDDLRNMRFQTPQSGMLIGAWFAFPTRHFQVWTTGDPALVVKVWPTGPDSLPIADAEFFADTIPFADYRAAVFELDSTWNSQRFVFVDFSAHSQFFGAGDWFHIGYTAVRNSADDSLAILSDDASGGNYASEWYNGQFVPMRPTWGGVNLMVRALMAYPEDTVAYVLEPGPATKDFRLDGVFPNPFNGQTRITFYLARPAALDLAVFDVLGRRQATLATGPRGAGHHTVNFDAAGLASGLYFVRLITPGGASTLKLLLEK